MRSQNQLTGKAAEARPGINDLQPRAALIPEHELPDNGPKTGSRRERREAARRASKTHDSLTRGLRRAAD